VVTVGAVSSARILVVDDDPDVAYVVRESLERAGYMVYLGRSGLEGLKLFFDHRPDLALVDIRMPEMDGLELCRRIREVSLAPVVFLTALGEEQDTVRGLSAGADDYIPKPVGRQELLARIEAVLRRSRMAPVAAPATVYSDAALKVDFSRHEVFRDGERVELTPTAFRLLWLLVNNADKVVSEEEILERVWGPGYESSDSVKWYVCHLRRKLKDEPANPRFILNVRGVGYRYQRQVG
jgi:two-component system KDP operon response regulator KdpE